MLFAINCNRIEPACPTVAGKESLGKNVFVLLAAAADSPGVGLSIKKPLLKTSSS